MLLAVLVEVDGELEAVVTGVEVELEEPDLLATLREPLAELVLLAVLVEVDGELEAVVTGVEAEEEEPVLLAVLVEVDGDVEVVVTGVDVNFLRDATSSL